MRSAGQRRRAMSSRSDTDSYQGAFFGVASVLLGLLVAVLGFAALLMWIDARNARHDAHSGQSVPTSMPGMQMGNGGGLTSYAGAAPGNADALAAAHTPYPADLPAALAGSVANVNLVLTDLTIEIAPGVKYAAWAWAGGAPGPVIHVRQGQLVKITLTNKGAISHSVDFHAARVALNVAFTVVLQGKSVRYTCRADVPGAFMYRCGTDPELFHIANGMYG